MIRSFLILLNPKSIGEEDEIYCQALSYVKSVGANLEVVVTTGNFDADVAAIKKNSKGRTDVFVFGGDGTLNIAVNAIDDPEVLITLFACGTGNDFSRGLLPANVKTEEILQSLDEVIVDVPRANDRYYVNVLGVGFDAQIVKNMQSTSKSFGALTYWIEAIKALFSFRESQLKFTVDDSAQQVEPSFMFVVGNGRYFGGGMKICPNAKLDDGFLSVVRANKLSLWQRLTLLAKVANGGHVKDERVKVHQAQCIEITTVGLPIEADGEYIGSTPVTISITKKLKFRTVFR